MSRQIDELSKNLARGMSRRKALWRFGVGIGAILAASRSAKACPSRTCHIAGDGDACVACCHARGCAHEEFGDCVSACVQGLCGGVTCSRG